MKGNQALAGTCSMTIDGVTYPVVGDPTWVVSQVARESLMGMDGWHGVSEKPTASKMGATLRDNGQQIVATLAAKVNATVVFSLANGKMIIGRNMAQIGEIEVNSSEATYSVKFEGPSVVEA